MKLWIVPFEGCQKYEVQHYILHHGGDGPNSIFIRSKEEINKEGIMAKRKVQKKNLSGLSGKTAAKRAAQMRRRATQKKPSYKPLAGDKTAKTRPSKYTTSFEKIPFPSK